MIDKQIKAVRDVMLQILKDRTENHIALYLAESITNQFIYINKNSDAFNMSIDVETMAWAELPKYLAAGIEGGKIWARGLTIEQKIAHGEDFQDVVNAYGELARIRMEIDSELIRH